MGMRKWVYVVFLIVVCCGCVNKKTAENGSEPENNNTTSENINALGYFPINGKVYVAPFDGLNLRSNYGITGEKIKLLPQNAELIVLERSEEKETIDGIHDYWYRVDAGEETGWVFGGYLASSIIAVLPLILEEADYSHIIRRSNFTVKFATQTADVKIYEDDTCILEKDHLSQYTFIINNNTAIFDREESLVFFELYTKKETEIEQSSFYYINFSSSNTDNIFYASSGGGHILRFNDFKGLIDIINKTNEYIDRSILVAAIPDGAVDIIDEYKKMAVFVAAFSDGRILSIGTDDQQASYNTGNLEIRLYDESGKRISASPITLQQLAPTTSDYYFDNVYNMLFIYNNISMTNIYKFNNNSINMREMPGFGKIINRIEYNNQVFFVTYISAYNKIYFYNTELELEAIMDVDLSRVYNIANVEIIDNTIRVYKYMPGK
jgi:hypothetical protein